MYHEYFGLRCNPFQLAPYAEFFFASRSHREALAALHWGLTDPTGLVLLTGDVGTGKTTVIRELFSRETGSVRTALVRNPRLGFDALLAGILRQLDVDAPRDRAAMLEALHRSTQSRRVVVVIDEAQQLPDESLEEFRLLSNTSPERFQLMLAGQPELLERLSSPELRQLNQRIAVRAVLNPLATGETADYLRHRVRAAGGEANRIFTRRALWSIARSSLGIPRRANILAHNALLLAYSSGSRKVRTRHVRGAVADYDRASITKARERFWNTEIFRRSLPPAVLLLAGLLLAFLRTEPARRHEPPQATRLAAANRAERERAAAARVIAQPRPASEAMAQPKPAADQREAQSVPEGVAEGVAAPDRSLDAKEPSGSGVTDEPRTTAETAAGDEIVVREGDTLSAIAQRYRNADARVDLRLLIAANPEIKDANLIYPGEKIRLQPK